MVNSKDKNNDSSKLDDIHKRLDTLRRNDVSFLIIVFLLLALNVIFTIALMPRTIETIHCPEPVACYEYEEFTEPTYSINFTGLKITCKEICEKGANNLGCYDWCENDRDIIELHEYISGNKSIFRCLE
jgi:hypothetical protein